MAAPYISLKTALVTGGSSGIGRAIAEKFSAQGIKTVIADIVPPADENEDIIYRQCDVTNGDDINALFAWMVKETGLPEILVLNAGRGIHEKLTEGDPEKWVGVLDLNVMGVLRCIRAFVPPMEQNKQGEVVFISSVSSTQAYTYGGVYSASKAAVDMIAETLKMETMPDVRITVVSAGVTDTNFFKNQISGHSSVESIGMGSLDAEDVAEDVWYAINKRKQITINKIITRPSGQSF